MFWNRPSSAVVFLTIGFAVATNAQTQKSFPSNDEIHLVVSQAERAIQQYKPLIDREEAELGARYTDAVAKDRQIVGGIETALTAFKSKPQAFNGPAGFLFFEWLDDAARNAVLCGSGAVSESAVQITVGNVAKAQALVTLGHLCSDVGTLIYTVSENAGALYQRYVEAEEQLATRATDIAQKCAEVLRKNSDPPRQ